MSETSIRIAPESMSPSSTVTSVDTAGPRERNETTSFAGSHRESSEENLAERAFHRTDDKSRVSYEEYEEEVERGAAGKQQRSFGDSSRRVLSLVERWQEWQVISLSSLPRLRGIARIASTSTVARTFRCPMELRARSFKAAVAATDAATDAASKDMPRKGQKRQRGRKVSPKGKSKGRAAVEDGTSDADVIGVIGVGDLRERLIRDMQEEIRLEQQGEKRREESEAEEAATRQRQLQRTETVLQRCRSACAEYALSNQQDENWARYMTCEGLPDPGTLSDMNTFLSLWSMKGEEASMDTVETQCRVITNLLRKIDEIVRFSIGITKEYAAECELISADLRVMLQRWIDLACYRLLRNIEANTIREDTKTARYVSVTEKAVCCIWLPIALPVGLGRLGADKDRPSISVQRKSIEVEFEDIDLTIRMPFDVDCHRAAIRCLWLAYDHCSIDAASYRMPRLPQRLLGLWDPSLELLEFTKREYEEKLRIRGEQAEERRLRLEERKAMLERMENPPASPRSDKRKKKRRGRKEKRQLAAQGKQSEFETAMESILPSKSDLLPYLPTPSEIVIRNEEEARLEARKLLFARCEKTEINLRKYRILGGVFRVDLLYQPPQPKDLGRDASLTTLQLPKEPRFVPFFRPYAAPRPPPDAERTPEIIEAEMKALETAMEALVLVTLKLPESVLWFEPPLIAHWIPEKNIWSTGDVHDVKFNEEKQTIAFRSGRLGVHGLAAYKYANLPFQSWELKPEVGKGGGDRGGVVLTVTAAIVQAEFVVRDDRVSLNSLTGAATGPLKGILGKYTEFQSLVEQLQQVGCDLFPDRDAASYLKGLSVKHPIVEKHLRECMALLSTSYAFSWSRWNVTRDFRDIVLQLKEIHGCVAKQRASSTLLVTPLRTMRVRCTDVSPEFSDLPLEDEDTEFYADLYQLALNTAGIKSRLLMERVSLKLVSTVTQLLERTNVINMSL